MRILFVEDEQKLADAMRSGLMKKGYAVDTLADGEKAYEHISIHHGDYDLIILDLMLPGMDGATICERVRARDITVPILILTARNEMSDKVNLLLTGADDYMVKPFSFAELVARITALSRRPSTLVPNTLAVRDIELNSVEQTVHREGELIPLTLKEFVLLEYLMRRPNQVVDREELLSHLWDFNYLSFSNVIDVHVKNLRKKLNGTDRENLIETVRGVGYRLTA